MANSPYVNYIDRSAGNYSKRSADTVIDRITIHSAGKSGDCYDLSELVNGASESSYHYGISTDGTVCLFVDEQFRSWSTGSKQNDESAINIICMNTESGVSYGELSDFTYSALLDLVEDICRRNFITELIYTGSKNTSNLTMHKWYASTSCPGEWLSAKYPEIAETISERLQAALVSENETEALKAQSTIAVNAINPYVIIPDPSVTRINYRKMRTAGVIGSMFWAGALFEPNHSKRINYINPYLKTQVAEIDKVSMPYALYATVRARSVEEAKQECYELWFVVSKYPPKLGLWLDLQFNVSYGAKRAIINKYYEYIVKWGLKDKCGFYTTKSQLRSIRYTDYLDKFSVWVIDHISDLSNLDSLLTPALFKFE